MQLWVVGESTIEQQNNSSLRLFSFEIWLVKNRKIIINLMFLQNGIMMIFRFLSTPMSRLKRSRKLLFGCCVVALPSGKHCIQARLFQNNESNKTAKVSYFALVCKIQSHKVPYYALFKNLQTNQKKLTLPVSLESLFLSKTAFNAHLNTAAK